MPTSLGTYLAVLDVLRTRRAGAELIASRQQQRLNGLIEYARWRSPSFDHRSRPITTATYARRRATKTGIWRGSPVSRSVLARWPPERSYSSTWSLTHCSGLGP
jgi:hypothetical protein